MTYREATPQDDELIAQHYIDMWLAIGMPEEELHADRYMMPVYYGVLTVMPKMHTHAAACLPLQIWRLEPVMELLQSSTIYRLYS